MMALRPPPHFLATLMSVIHERCHLCQSDSPLSHKKLICTSCQSLLHSLPTFTIHANHPLPLLVCSHYDAPFDRVMSAYKDQEHISALMVLYHLIYMLPKPTHLTAHNAVIMPTPTTKQRLIKRGFNPVLTLAKCLSYHWQIPLATTLRRMDNDTHQRGLNKEERLHNVQHDFYLTDYPTTPHVILFDDVVTTGSTLSAIANTLLNKNPKQHLIAVGVMHGKSDFHLPLWTS